MSDAALLDTLSRLQPLAGLGAASLHGLLPLCRRQHIARSAEPFALDAWQGQVVYLTKGHLKVDLADGSMAVFVGGAGDALMPLSAYRAAPVSAKAITDVELLHFDEETLDIVVTWDQIIAPAGTEGRSDAPDWRTKSGMFAAQNLVNGSFAALPAANIDSLLGRFQRVSVKRGDVIVCQGDPGDYYYVIDAGRCVVTREVAGGTVELAQLKGGDTFGEEALLADVERNATVTMKTDGALLRLDKADFAALLQEPLLRKLAPAEAARRVAAGATWIDTRFPAEYRLDGLLGARNIPLNELRRAMSMLQPEKEYIVYCQSGRRSSAAAFLLSQKGYRASLLDGGLRALVAEKGKA